jgi:dTMP kinase
MNRGKFITLEGVDGAGKSSHLQWIADVLRERPLDVVESREPGGTTLGEALRRILLAEPMDIETETLLMFAARREHIVKVIRPALDSGHWLVCDRFTDATFAYQGGGRGVSLERIAQLEAWVHQDVQPDLTLVFDVPLELAISRVHKETARPDRFEQQDAAFFTRVRDTYLARAKAEPRRIVVVDSSGSFDDTRAQIRRALERL